MRMPFAWPMTSRLSRASSRPRFVRQVLWQEGGKLSTLLTADFSMLNGTLTTYYGAADGTGLQDFHKVSFKNGERAGLVTQAGLMASQALDNDTSPVRRGLYVRQALLCQPVPDPPPTINVVPPRLCEKMCAIPTAKAGAPPVRLNNVCSPTALARACISAPVTGNPHAEIVAVAAAGDCPTIPAGLLIAK